jgi:hypothetical protein
MRIRHGEISPKRLPLIRAHGLTDASHDTYQRAFSGLDAVIFQANSRHGFILVFNLVFGAENTLWTQRLQSISKA